MYFSYRSPTFPALDKISHFDSLRFFMENNAREWTEKNILETKPRINSE